MSADTPRRLTPEEQELDSKRAELAVLEGQLTEQELALATLQAALHAFEGRYLRRVGRLCAELDTIEAHIAEALARRHPENPATAAHAAQACAQAQASAEATEDAVASHTQEAFHPPDQLKKLYRDVAKHVHPDLGTTEEDRGRRHQFMTDANRAYQAGDETGLWALLHAWEQSPAAVQGEGIVADLVRVIRQIAQVRERLSAIETALTQLQGSDLYQLHTQVEAEAIFGRDLLAIMAERLQRQIADARRRLAEVLQRSTQT